MIMGGKLRPEVKVKWLAWLRDPTHKQSYGVMRNDLGYCCLGGLCQVFLDSNPAVKEEWSPVIGRKFKLFGHAAYLPRQVVEWAMEPPFPDPKDYQMDIELKIGSVLRGAGSHNDSGHTFLEIADAVEAQL